MHDRASANGVAMQTIKVLYPNLVDIGCYSHTIDHMLVSTLSPQHWMSSSDYGLVFLHTAQEQISHGK